jgi:hypothetical protein
MHNYTNYLHWSSKQVSGDGIILGADITQEWLLPWWWKNYSKYNAFPVVFIDFGLSFEMKEWCRERGQLIPLRVFHDFVAERSALDPQLVDEWERCFRNQFWDSRNVWFKKPLACLQTPFQRSLWIDNDCEIKGSLEPLFTFADQETGIAMVPEPIQEYKYTIYNSGVFPFRNGIKVILDWGKKCLEETHIFRGDQEAFSHLVFEQKLQIPEIPRIYNWSRIAKESPHALVLHWHGEHGKLAIRKQMNLEARRGVIPLT